MVLLFKQGRVTIELKLIPYVNILLSLNVRLTKTMP
jgi:hypothetical protein